MPESAERPPGRFRKTGNFRQNAPDYLHHASAADRGDGGSSFYIEKNATDHSTATTITELSEADSLKELARLSGAAQLTESVLANAKEMKDLAEKKKQN